VGMTSDRRECLENPVGHVLNGNLVVARHVRERHGIEIRPDVRVRRAAQVQPGQAFAQHTRRGPRRRMGCPIEPDTVAGQNDRCRRLQNIGHDDLAGILVVARPVDIRHRIAVHARVRVQRAAHQLPEDDAAHARHRRRRGMRLTVIGPEVPIAIHPVPGDRCRRLRDAAADVLDRILIVARHVGEGHRIEVRTCIAVGRDGQL
jgi:hypothetical protein